VCDQTLEPSWLKQRFVFDVPSDAAEEYRGYNLRVLVKAKSLIGMDPVLAKLDVPFSCLKEETPIEGWFPLRPSRATVLATNVSGSIRLKLHWIHSVTKFSNHFVSSIEKRYAELKDHSENNQFSNIRMSLGEESSKKMAEESESNLNDRLVVVEDFGNQSPIRSSANETSHILLPSIDLDESRDDVQVPDQMVNSQDELTPLHCFKGKYEYWFRVCEKFSTLHNKLSSTMDRNATFQECNRIFSESFDRECLRNYVHVYTQNGTLTIIPVQITNLPEINHNLHIKISYGKEVSIIWMI
jgi:hypothetical protein